MIGWSEDYNWTYEQFYNVCISSLENGSDCMNLDCEHSSYENMEEIVEWANSHGYKAEISDTRESVRVWKE